jgi:hypothetical protein
VLHQLEVIYRLLDSLRTQQAVLCVCMRLVNMERNTNVADVRKEVIVGINGECSNKSDMNRPTLHTAL